MCCLFFLGVTVPGEQVEVLLAVLPYWTVRPLTPDCTACADTDGVQDGGGGRVHFDISVLKLAVEVQGAGDGCLWRNYRLSPGVRGQRQRVQAAAGNSKSENVRHINVHVFDRPSHWKLWPVEAIPDIKFNFQNSKLLNLLNLNKYSKSRGYCDIPHIGFACGTFS